jgi:hypothetical protein
MEISDDINELATALAKAQKEFEAAERGHVARVTSKKGEGSSYSFNYADLAAYLDVCREPLGSNGLSFVQFPRVNGETVSVETLLLHSSGQFIRSDPLTLQLSADERGWISPQAVGSGITYARRYSLSALIGMASEADDDGNAASGNRAETGPREVLPPCPECDKQTSVIVGRQEFGGGLVCFKKKEGCGHTWGTAEHPIIEKPEAEKKTNGRKKADAPLTTGKDPNDAASPYSKAMGKILNFHGKRGEFELFRNSVLKWLDESPDDTSADQKKLIEKALTAREDEMTALPM